MTKIVDVSKSDQDIRYLIRCLDWALDEVKTLTAECAVKDAVNLLYDILTGEAVEEKGGEVA